MSLNERIFRLLPKSNGFQFGLFLVVVIVMGNIDAVVDMFLHPEIPFFDEEHLIVGGITSAISLALFGGGFFYLRYLNRALQTIDTLERLLPICSYCKKIRTDDEHPWDSESWTSVEEY